MVSHARVAGDFADVGGVGGHYGVVAPDGSFDDGDVDDVVVAGACCERADGLCLFVGQRLGGAQGEETGQAGLAGARLARLRRALGWGQSARFRGRGSRRGVPTFVGR